MLKELSSSWRLGTCNWEVDNPIQSIQVGAGVVSKPKLLPEVATAKHLSPFYFDRFFWEVTEVTEGRGVVTHREPRRRPPAVGRS